MKFKLSGKLIQVFDTQNITDNFRKREFVIDAPEDFNGKTYPNTIKFQLNQDKCDLIDEYGVGDMLTVSFSIRGKKWEKNGNLNYFNNLVAFRIERESGEQDNDIQEDFSHADENDSDLPF